MAVSGQVRELQEQVEQLSLDARRNSKLRERLERLEEWQEKTGEHLWALSRDTLAMGTEIKGSLAAMEGEMNATATEGEARLEALAQKTDEQLREMQGFIVKAAEDAKGWRNDSAFGIAAPGGMAVGGVTTGGMATGGMATAEIAQLLERQRAAQAEFIARRRAEDASSFPGPGAGVGL